MSNFVVPPDVIRRLGNGDTVTGLAVIRDAFGLSLAEPLGQIPAETIAEVGHGDPQAGRRVLTKFVAKVRQQRTKTRAA